MLAAIESDTDLETKEQTFIAFDVETHPIKPGMLAPRLVCLSYAYEFQSRLITGLVLRDEAIALFRQWLKNPQIVLIAHNAIFDVGVFCAEDSNLVPLVFEAYLDHRIRCTARRQEIIDVAIGMRKFRRKHGQVSKSKYGLIDLLSLYDLKDRQKDDTPRLRYGLLEAIPVENWTQEERDYAIDDSIDALAIYQAQTKACLAAFGQELPNQAQQQQASWALYLQSMWGLRAEREATTSFLNTCAIEIAKMEEAIKDTGLLKTDKNGIVRTATGAPSKSTKAIAERVKRAFDRIGLPVPMTDSSEMFPDGQIRTNTETLLLTDDPVLHALAAASTFSKHLGQWGPVLTAACLRVVCVRYQTLMENGRTSCGGSEGQEGTNIQNPPRKGEVRPCFIPRSGWLFCSTDADTVELRALAYVCRKLVGWSRMADVLDRQAKEGGPDLHVTLGASIAGISIDRAHELHKTDDVEFAQIRQLAKHVNFALAGGAGAEKLASMAHGFGICLTQSWSSSAEARAIVGDDVCPVFSDGINGETVVRWVSISAEVTKATELREIWFQTWPEMRINFRIVGNQVREYGCISQLVSGRIRGDVNFTAAANTYFSGLVADAMKDCCVALAYECYTGKCYWCRTIGCERCGSRGQSPLMGSRPIMFLHDEPILEHPNDEKLSARCERQERTVVWCLEKWMPEIPFSSSYVVTRRWQKGAKRIKSDPTAPVRPQKVIENGKERVVWVRD